MNRRQADKPKMENAHAAKLLRDAANNIIEVMEAWGDRRLDAVDNIDWPMDERYWLYVAEERLRKAASKFEAVK